MDEEPPFVCSLTLAVPALPVSTPCGHTFERAALEAYRTSSVGGSSIPKVCPMCQRLLPDPQLACFGLGVNIALRDTLDAWWARTRRLRTERAQNADDALKLNRADLKIDDAFGPLGSGSFGVVWRGEYFGSGSLASGAAAAAPHAPRASAQPAAKGGSRRARGGRSHTPRTDSAARPDARAQAELALRDILRRAVHSDSLAEWAALLLLALALGSLRFLPEQAAQPRDAAETWAGAAAPHDAGPSLLGVAQGNAQIDQLLSFAWQVANVRSLCLTYAVFAFECALNFLQECALNFLQMFASWVQLCVEICAALIIGFLFCFSFSNAQRVNASTLPLVSASIVRCPTDTESFAAATPSSGH